MELKEHAEFIDSQNNYLKRNAQLFEIYQGNLLPHVQLVMKRTLSENYYNRIKHRILPINILRRVVDKMAQTYRVEPRREATSNPEILEFYEKELQLNNQFHFADEFSQLFKGYAAKPYMSSLGPRLKILPYDRFLVYSQSYQDATQVDYFYEYIGRQPCRKKGGKIEYKDAWQVTSDNEMFVIDDEGTLVPELMIDPISGEQLSGENPLGYIPVFYGNRSNYCTMPVQDTDNLEMAKVLPVMMSDLAGAIMFQCFSIVYGIDCDAENMVMSPNAFWAIKSDKDSDKSPQVGTIKPQVDINQVMSFIKDTFVTWLETKGIRVGSIGSTQGQSFQSGISKIIDEMDTYEARKKSMDAFIEDEKRFFEVLRKRHNNWVSNGQLDMPLLPPTWEVKTFFDQPSPIIDRSSEIDVIIKEKNNDLLSQKSAIERANPKWTDERIEQEIEAINSDVDLEGFNGLDSQEN